MCLYELCHFELVATWQRLRLVCNYSCEDWACIIDQLDESVWVSFFFNAGLFLIGKLCHLPVDSDQTQKKNQLSNYCYLFVHLFVVLFLHCFFFFVCLHTEKKKEI